MVSEAPERSGIAVEDPAALLERLSQEMAGFNSWFRTHGPSLSTRAVAGLAAGVEEIARFVGQSQLIGTGLISRHNIAKVGETDHPFGWQTPAETAKKRGDYKDNAEFMRSRLGIGRQEAARRLALAEATEPGVLLTGTPVPPRLPILGQALQDGTVSSQAGTVIRNAIDAVSRRSTPERLAAMEEALTEFAARTDTDTLRQLARKWENALDPDGTEPSEAELRAQQGLRYTGKRGGLHRIEISASDEQHEYLATVYNLGANPRLRRGTATAGTLSAEAGPEGGSSTGTATGREPDSGQSRWEQRSRPQKLLDALVGACQLALATDKLPASGGRRPQLMVTIDYNDLASTLGRAGHAGYSGQISPRSIRKIACDAGLIPVVLGGEGQVLDLGRAERYHSVHQRQAIIARDIGCAFPDCTMPAPWTECHHIHWWEHGGSTSIDQGTCLCSYHHHLIHQGDWTIESRHGIPWFIPPGYLDPDRTPVRNLYWLAGVTKPPESPGPHGPGGARPA